jgi:hypothetical protein
MRVLITIIAMAFSAGAFNAANAADFPPTIDWTEADLDLHNKFLATGVDVANGLAKYYKTAATLKVCGYPKMAEELHDRASEKLARAYLDRHHYMVDIHHASAITETAEMFLRTYNQGYAEGVKMAADPKVMAQVCEIALSDKDELLK